MSFSMAVRMLVLSLLLILTQAANAYVSLSVNIAPPPIPVYEQPPCPGEDYLWTPGYWSWDGDDYYWVPGTWVVAPQPGYLWTPGYWYWNDRVYAYREGYWGPRVGFYGGINYGFGYGGVGYEGGYWNNNHFFYNRSVTVVNETVVHNTYNKTVINNVTVNRVSFNGGTGGIPARPTPMESLADRDPHLAPLAAQEQHAQMARGFPQSRLQANGGRPPVAATPRPGEFNGRGFTAASAPGGMIRPPASQPANVGASAIAHARDVAPRFRSMDHDAGSYDRNALNDRQSMFARQEQERQQLQERQDFEHQRFAQGAVDEDGRQQMERDHLAQTNDMLQRHQQEEQDFEGRHSRRNVLR